MNYYLSVLLLRRGTHRWRWKLSLRLLPQQNVFHSRVENFPLYWFFSLTTPKTVHCFDSFDFVRELWKQRELDSSVSYGFISVTCVCLYISRRHNVCTRNSVNYIFTPLHRCVTESSSAGDLTFRKIKVKWDGNYLWRERSYKAYNL